MQDALKTYLAMASGLTEVSRKRAKAAAKKLVKQSGATVEQVQALTDDLLSTSRANRESLTTLVRYEIDRALGAVGLATVDEVETLTSRIHELEAELRRARQEGASGDEAPREARAAAAEARAEAAEVKDSGRKAAAKKAPAKKAPAVEVTPDPAKALPETAESATDGAVPAKSTAAKKSAAKKAPAKKAAKAAAKKAPAKKAASPQAVATKPARVEVAEQVAEVQAAKVAKLPATNPATATSESGGTEL